MTTRTKVSPEELVAKQWPYGRRLDEEEVSRALSTAAEVLRRVNHDMVSHASETLPCAPDAYPVLSSLTSIVDGVEQLSEHLARWARNLTKNETLRSTDTRDFESGSATARAAAELLGKAAAGCVVVSKRLGEAWAKVGRLYHDA